MHHRLACVAMVALHLAGSAFAGEAGLATRPAVPAVVRHAGAPGKPAVFDVGDTIEVAATLAEAPAGAAVTARWTDSYGRLAAEATQPVGPDGRAVFRFPVRACVSTGNQIELLGDGRPLGEPVRFGLAPQGTRPLRDWYVFPWAQYPAGTGDTLRSVGINGGMAYRNVNFDKLVWNDLRFYVDQMGHVLFAPYTRNRQTFRTMWDAFLKEWNEKGTVNRPLLVREPCLSDPATLDRIRAMMKEHVAPHAPYKPIWYNMQDEGGMAKQNQKNEFCQGPFCLAGFRTWLKTQYPSLEALNESWGTAFRTYDEVLPFTDYELRKREKDLPLARRRYGGFCDHRAYMDLVMTRALDVARSACREADPDGLFGITGTQGPSPWPGFDYSLIPTVVDIAHYYDYDNAIEIARSFHPRHHSRLFPYPGWSTGNVRVREDWYYLFHGLAATGIWDQAMELLDRDGRPTPKVLAFKDTFLELQRGIGRLIMNIPRDNDPIAVYFSQPTLRLREVLKDEPMAQDATWTWDDTGVIRALEDLGFQYEFVAYREVEQGILEKGKYKLLFVLNTLGLSDKEAAAIETWVKAGGVLVTDERTGLFDERGRGRSTPALTSLHGDRPASDRALPGLALFASGGGKTILLKSVPLAAYPKERLVGGESVAAVKAAMARLTEAAGLAPRVKVLDRAGRQAHGVEVVQFVDGSARYVALFRNPGNDGRLNRLLRDAATRCFAEPLPVAVHFDRAAALYNVREGKFLGETDQDATTIQPWSPTVYALLPYRVTGLETDAPPAAGPGEIVTLRLRLESLSGRGRGEGGAPAPSKGAADGVARHVLRVDVFGPDGALRMFYSRNVETAAGAAAMTIPFALNDATGAWRIRVRDVATGVSAERTLQLK